jgi:hypothetical protein
MRSTTALVMRSVLVLTLVGLAACGSSTAARDGGTADRDAGGELDQSATTDGTSGRDRTDQGGPVDEGTPDAAVPDAPLDGSGPDGTTDDGPPDAGAPDADASSDVGQGDTPPVDGCATPGLTAAIVHPDANGCRTPQMEPVLFRALVMEDCQDVTADAGTTFAWATEPTTSTLNGGTGNDQMATFTPGTYTVRVTASRGGNQAQNSIMFSICASCPCP